MTNKYLFFADGDLRVFISELVAQQYCQDGEHHLFTFNTRIKETWDLYDWHSRTYLPWVHKGGDSMLKKWQGLRLRIHHILETVADRCEGADEIVIHTFQIYSERINYLLNYLQDRFPKAKVRVRLIPDGCLNLKRRPMHGIRKVPSLVNRLKWCLDSKLNYYVYDGDRLGADADIVDRIYLPKGFPHEYLAERVHWLNMPTRQNAISGEAGETALVVGTALTQTGVCTKADMQRVADGIQAWMQAKGIRRAWYKPHHKEDLNQLELWSPGCEIMHTKKGIERLILEKQYDHLIGICSSALLNARLMFEDLSVTSCGLDVLERRLKKGASAEKYRQACQDLGVGLVPVLKPTTDELPRRNAA